MRTAVMFLAVAAALALQATLAGLAIGSFVPFNLVLVAVVYAALAFGPVMGLLTGSVGGIAQDALAGGIVGIGGFAKTLVGFVVGVLGAQFIVSQPIPRFVMFVGATLLHELCFQALHAVAEARPFRLPPGPLLTQAAINGALGVSAFWLVERVPVLVQGRRARGASLSRRRY